MVALPKPVAAYIAATNDHDVHAIAAQFAEGATVKDEGREHRGLTGIRQWAEHTTRKYDFKLEPTEAQEIDSTVVLTCLVTGNFPGSPLEIQYEFSFERDKIIRLVIG